MNHISPHNVKLTWLAQSLQFFSRGEEGHSVLGEVFLLLQMRLWLAEDGGRGKGKSTVNCHTGKCGCSQPALAVTPMLLVSTDSTVCTKTVLSASET